MKKNKTKNTAVIGWREWIALPELGIKKIKAKIDTGARTSALHAFSVEIFRKNGKDKVCFAIHPKQRNTKEIITCIADVVDVRWVTDSGGHKEERFVIKTPVCVGDHTWPIEITLTNRDIMTFRMLLGRTALTNFLVNSQKSFLLKATL